MISLHCLYYHEIETKRTPPNWSRIWPVHTTWNIMFSEKTRQLQVYINVVRNSSGASKNEKNLKWVFLDSYTFLLYFVVVLEFWGALCYDVPMWQFCGYANWHLYCKYPSPSLCPKPDLLPKQYVIMLNFASSRQKWGFGKNPGFCPGEARCSNRSQLHCGDNWSKRPIAT